LHLQVPLDEQIFTTLEKTKCEPEPRETFSEKCFYNYNLKHFVKN